MSIKLLKFTASWCGTCKKADMFLERTKEERKYDIVEIDTDLKTNRQLCSKYQIQYLPTFIAIKPNGDVVSKYIGFDNQKIKKFLEELNYLNER